MAQAFVSNCSFFQVQWNENNNDIKTKFTSKALNVIKKYVRRNEIGYKKYGLEKTKFARIWQYGKIQY